MVERPWARTWDTTVHENVHTIWELLNVCIQHQLCDLSREHENVHTTHVQRLLITNNSTQDTAWLFDQPPESALTIRSQSQLWTQRLCEWPPLGCWWLPLNKAYSSLGVFCWTKLMKHAQVTRWRMFLHTNFHKAKCQNRKGMCLITDLLDSRFRRESILLASLWYMFSVCVFRGLCSCCVNPLLKVGASSIASGRSSRIAIPMPLLEIQDIAILLCMNEWSPFQDNVSCQLSKGWSFWSPARAYRLLKEKKACN